MTTGNLPVLRGQLTHVFTDDERTLDTLTSQMELIGLRYRVNPTQRDAEVGVQWVDMDLLMSLERNNPRHAPGLSMEIPIIAMLGTQSPSCIERVLAFDPCMVITKPVPAQGVYMAMSVALHEARKRDQDLIRMLALEEQLRAQPLVISAVISVMASQSCNECDALQWLREQARSRLISLEALAIELTRQRIEGARTKRRFRN